MLQQHGCVNTGRTKSNKSFTDTDRDYEALDLTMFIVRHCGQGGKKPLKLSRGMSKIIHFYQQLETLELILR